MASNALVCTPVQVVAAKLVRWLGGARFSDSSCLKFLQSLKMPPYTTIHVAARTVGGYFWVCVGNEVWRDVAPDVVGPVDDVLIFRKTGSVYVVDSSLRGGRVQVDEDVWIMTATAAVRKLFQAVDAAGQLSACDDTVKRLAAIIQDNSVPITTVVNFVEVLVNDVPK